MILRDYKISALSDHHAPTTRRGGQGGTLNSLRGMMIGDEQTALHHHPITTITTITTLMPVAAFPHCRRHLAMGLLRR
jgi:hypothetical protein